RRSQKIELPRDLFRGTSLSIPPVYFVFKNASKNGATANFREIGNVENSYNSHFGIRARLRRGGNGFRQDVNGAQSTQHSLHPARHAGQLLCRSPLGGPLHLLDGGSRHFLRRNGRTRLPDGGPAKPANRRLTNTPC